MKKMKRIMAGLLSLLLVFSLAACSGGGDKADFEMDVQQVYEELTALPDMPALIELPEDKALDFLGLDMSQCVQAVAAICAVNIQADEIWLVEAKDSSAAAEIEELARSRVQQRMEEFKGYSPEQYQVLESVRSLCREDGLTAIVVIHDLSLALRFCDRFLMLRDGTVYRYGGREILDPLSLRETYGVDAKVVEVEGKPLVMVS